jgi:hypothetical protein
MPNNNIQNDHKFATQSSLDSYVWSISNILRRSNCAGAYDTCRDQRLSSVLLRAFSGELL